MQEHLSQIDGLQTLSKHAGSEKVWGVTVDEWEGKIGAKFFVIGPDGSEET